MAKKNAGFVDEHIEKVALGLCGMVFLGAVYIGFLSGRFSSAEGMNARKLADATGDAADQAARSILSKQPDPRAAGAKTVTAQNDPTEVLKDWFGDEAKGLIVAANLKSPVARTQPFPPIFHSTTGIAPEDRHALAEMVQPGLPVATTGRSTFELPVQKPALAEYDGNEVKGKHPATTRNWVAVAAQVDLIQQDINFKTVKYPPDGSYLAIVDVQLERFDQSEPWKGWRPVETYQPFMPAPRPQIFDSRTGEFKLEGLTEFKDLIESKQEFIARPLLRERTAGDRIVYPPVPYFPESPRVESSDPTTRVKKWASTAQKARDAKPPFSIEDLDAAFIMLRAVIGTAGVKEQDLTKAQSSLAAVVRRLKRVRKDAALDDTIRPPEKLMPVVAYDLNVIPGHTYVYRMRYEVLNIYAGNPGELIDPADAEKLTVFSAWSPETRPITIESDTYFYLTRADEAKKELTVTVYKKRGREPVRESAFKVAIGEEIGGERRRGNTRVDFSTTAICLDIDFNRNVNGKNEVALVYVDTSDGRVHERLLSVDKNDKFRLTLESEKSAQR